mgnify:CR=1 FL=1
MIDTSTRYGDIRRQDAMSINPFHARVDPCKHNYGTRVRSITAVRCARCALCGVCMVCMYACMYACMLFVCMNCLLLDSTMQRTLGAVQLTKGQTARLAARATGNNRQSVAWSNTLQLSARLTCLALFNCLLQNLTRTRRTRCGFWVPSTSSEM